MAGGAAGDSEAPSWEGLNWVKEVLGEASGAGGGQEAKREAKGGYSFVPRLAPLSVLALSLARCLGTAFFFFLLLQQLWGPARHNASGGALFAGWFYSDKVLLGVQFVFDLMGAFLSSMTYAILPTLVDQSNKTQASTILSVTLTLGTFLGLGISVAISSALPPM